MISSFKILAIVSFKMITRIILNRKKNVDMKVITILKTKY